MEVLGGRREEGGGRREVDRHGGGGGKGPVLPLSPFSVAPMVVDYPWDWVSPQLLNRKGEEIFYPVVDDQ
jgi:hypothetical protein